MGSNASFTTFKLGDLGQVMKPFWNQLFSTLQRRREQYLSHVGVLKVITQKPCVIVKPCPAGGGDSKESAVDAVILREHTYCEKTISFSSH